MGKKIFFLFACLFMTASMAFAQRQVTGTVIDSETGEPIPGASVKVQGTTLGVQTNIDGKFTINNVPSTSKTLTVSFMGMKSVEETIRNNMTIALESDVKALNEVMVVAFGQQTKESFTGSATVVGAEELSRKTSANALNAIVGEVPGLQMRGESGAPGAGAGSINIRGLSSLYAEVDPLIIVDGAPYYASLTNIAKDDIESITVLKDAASAALYGAAGAAGVILVTTKKGKTEEAVVNADVRWGMNSRAIQDYKTITNPAQYYETYYTMMNNYYTGQGQDAITANANANSAMLNRLSYNVYTVPDGQYLIGTNGKLNPNATLGRSYTASNGETFWLQPDDWTDAAYSNAFRQEYNVNISAGNSKSSFFTSVGYLNEDGIIEYSDYERFNARAKADYQAKKWLKVGANLGYTHSNQNSNPNMSTQWGVTNLMYFTSFMAPIYPIYVRTVDANGNPVIKIDQYGHQLYDYGIPSTGYVGNPSRGFMSTANPLGSNRFNTQKNEGHQLNQTYTADVRITDWLSFKSTNNINLGVTNYHLYGNPFEGPEAGDNGNLDKYTQTNFRQDYIQTLMFNHAFGRNDVQVQVGHEWNKTRTKMLEAYARGGFSPEVQEIYAMDNRYDSYSYTNDFNREGWFANALYDWDKKYYASAAYRRDASSYFDPDHRWGNFWSVGGAWLINKESFMQDTSSWLDMLKLKLSVGQQGNDNIGSFNYVNLYRLNQTGNGAMSPSFMQFGNENITWETTTNTNVGVEWSMWKGRFVGGLDFYNKRVNDLLFWLSIPESFGARGYYGNMGDIRNRGVELTLGGDLVRTKNVTWNLTANMAHNRTKILSLPEAKVRQNGGYAETSDFGGIYSWYEEGKPMNNAFLYEFAGIYNKENYEKFGIYYKRDENGTVVNDDEGNPIIAEPYDSKKDGMAMYWVDEDLIDYENGGGAITSRPGKKHSYATTSTGAASRYTQGSTLPKVSGGFSTTLKVYDFDFSADFDFQIGGKVFDSGYQTLMTPESGSTANCRTFHKDILNAYSPTNTGSDIPRLQFGDQYAASSSDRFLTNASYLNFGSFSVGYTLPKTLTRQIKIEKLRIYCQGQNLCFWSKRQGFDPRYSFGETADTNVYSPVRTVSWGLQATF